MNFQEWYATMPKLTEQELRISVISWDACKTEVLKTIKSKYPKFVNDLVYEDGWDTACMSIEEEVGKL